MIDLLKYIISGIMGIFLLWVLIYFIYHWIRLQLDPDYRREARDTEEHTIYTDGGFFSYRGKRSDITWQIIFGWIFFLIALLVIYIFIRYK